MPRRFLSALLALLTLAALSMTASVTRADDAEPSPQDLVAIANAIAPSLVRVEYTLQYDKGESPGGEVSYYRGSAEQWVGRSGESWEEAIQEERPAERAGYLIAANRVLTADPMLHARFIKDISVRAGDQLVKATPVAYAKMQNAWILELAEPLKTAKPMTFDSKLAGPYYAVAYAQREGSWMIGVSPASWRVGVDSDGRQFSPGSPDSLIVTGTGVPVGLTMTGILPTDGSWKGGPNDWATIDRGQMESLLGKVTQASDGCVLRVALTLRSPGSSGQDSSFGGRYGGDEEEEITEWNGSGVLVDEAHVLVLAQLKPKITARLEKVRVFGPDGKETEATFDGTLKDYGAFVAKLKSPMKGVMTTTSKEIRAFRDLLLVEAEVTVRGETRTAYYNRERIRAFDIGWRRHVFPMGASSRGRSYYDDGASGTPQSFIFDTDGTLVAIPISRRQKVVMQNRYDGWSGNEALLTPVGYITEAIADRKSSYDADNRPLSEEEENRLAWLGVEMQPMDPDLARANNVVDETRGGHSGALVSYVYPNSPAAAAGIEVGDIVLRLHIPDQPKPLEVELESNEFSGMFDRFFEMMDEIPEEYFDRIPKPWGSAENSLTRALTDLGFGQKFTAEVFHDGKVQIKNFVVSQGPPHYDSAKRFKSEQAGLTARDLTYEVRRFYQLRDEEPGVIISKVEKGEKAAIAGLKPFEVITAINDTPVHSVTDFEKALAAGGEFRLNVKRLTEGRIVKIKIDAAKPQEAEPGKP